MGLFSRKTESRNAPSAPITYGQLLMMLGGGGPITTLGALSRSGIVFRCAQVAASALATLPLKEYRDRSATGSGQREELPRSPLLDEPHRELTQVEWKELIALHLFTWGDAFLAIEYNQAGSPLYLDPLPPNAVTPRRVRPTDSNPYGRVYDVTLNPDYNLAEPPGATPRLVTYTPNEILHIPGLGWDGLRGLSPVGAARKGIASSIHAEEFAAKLWEAGGLQSGVLTAETGISESQAKTLKERWQEKVGGLNGAHEIAVLDANVKFQPTSINPKDAQFVEARQFQTAEIAHIFGLNESLMPADSAEWLKFFLLPYLRRIEERLSRLLPRGRFCEFVAEGLMRGDSSKRAAMYAVMLQNGVYSVNEVREMENLPPIEGGDKYERLGQGVGTPNAHVEVQPK